MIVEPCPCGKNIAFTENGGAIIILFLRPEPPNNLLDPKKYIVLNKNSSADLVTHIAWS